VEIEELFGFPARPLVVHAAVATLASAALPRAHRAYAPIASGLALVAGARPTWTVVEVGHRGAEATWHDAGEDGG
jgi:hypothetical protein